jgi:hypothetical protein
MTRRATRPFLPRDACASSAKIGAEATKGTGPRLAATRRGRFRSCTRSQTRRHRARRKPPRPRGEGGRLERTLGRPGVQGCDREMHTDRHASYEASSMAPICNRVHPAWFEKDRVGCVRVGRLVCPCCGCLARGGYERRRRRRRHLDLGRVRCLLERELRRFPYAGCQRIVR